MANPKVLSPDVFLSDRAVAPLGNSYHAAPAFADPTARFHDLGSDYYTSRIDKEKRTRNHI